MGNLRFDLMTFSRPRTAVSPQLSESRTRTTTILIPGSTASLPLTTDTANSPFPLPLSSGKVWPNRFQGAPIDRPSFFVGDRSLPGMIKASG
jgi:hypothetical protein